MSEHDALFVSREPSAPFRFDAEVARVLPDMLQRSIPGYSALIHLLGVLASECVPSGGRVYDLGCSLGAVTLSVRQALGSRAATIIAVDSSAAMVERCREIVAAAPDSRGVEVHLQDVLDVAIEDAALVVLNFTLQFVATARRDELVGQIARGLRPGGVLVLSEKLQPEDAQDGVLMRDLHDAFRRSNGYSHLELARKRQALEDVLLPETSEVHRARLQACGLKVTEWFRALQFVSLLGVKE